MKGYTLDLDNYIVPKFGDVPVDSLERETLIDWLDEITESTPAMANHLHATLSVVVTRVNRQGKMKHHLLFGTD